MPNEKEVRERTSNIHRHPITSTAQHMKPIKLQLALEELTLLVSLASDQLFRREFIDPKMPGYKGDPREVAFGKAMVGRLRLLIGQESSRHTTSSAEAVPRPAAGLSKRANGMSGAL